MVIAWRAKDVADLLGVPPDQEVVAIRLSLDGETVEIGTRNKDVVETRVDRIVSYGNDRTL